MKHALGALAASMLFLSAPVTHAATIFNAHQDGFDKGEEGGLKLGFSSIGVYRDAHWTLATHPRPDWDRDGDPSPAPEPPQWAMFVVGAGLLTLVYARRGRARPAPVA